MMVQVYEAQYTRDYAQSRNGYGRLGKTYYLRVPSIGDCDHPPTHKVNKLDELMPLNYSSEIEM